MDLSEAENYDRQFVLNISEGELAVLLVAAGAMSDNYPAGSKARFDLDNFQMACLSHNIDPAKFHLR